MKQKGQRKGRELLIALLALLGLSVLLYPIIESRYLEKREVNEIVKTFREAREAKEREKDPSKISVFEATHKAIGVLLIPEIDIILPIYGEISEYALSKGAGALPNFTDLSGKKGTLCALSSHNGLSASGLFTNLHKLKKDSLFYIETGNDKILEYKVVDTAIVEPTDASLLQADKDKAKAVLISCSSVEGINSHRLLVFGEKVNELANVEAVNKSKLTLSIYEQFVLGTFVIFWLILVWQIIKMATKRRRRRKNAKARRMAALKQQAAKQQAQAKSLD